MISLRDIRIESYCEHHMVPIVEVAHVAICRGGWWSGSASSPGWSMPMLGGCSLPVTRAARLAVAARTAAETVKVCRPDPAAAMPK